MAAADQDGPPLTELESLQLKANQVTDESLESTRRMIALCEDVSTVKNRSLLSSNMTFMLEYIAYYKMQVFPFYF